MKKTISISIPEPCHEDWNKMTPKEKGRHCAACNKTVIDFTSKTDEQVIKTFENENNLCGRFKTQQLNREMFLARKDKNNYLSIAASGLFAFMALGHQDIHAQGEPRTVKVDSLNTPQVKGKIATSVINQRTVSGIVTTADDGLPLPGASVIIKGTYTGAQTDFDGKYSIKVNTGDVLIISYVGMKTTEITIGNSNTYNIVIELDEDLLLGEVIVGGITAVQQYTNHCNMSYDEPELVASEAEQEKSRAIREHHQKWKERNKARRTKWKAERIAKREAIKNGEKERTAFGKFFFGIKSLFSKK
ncbi:carboxypeptidase-like regulatory domain-containing protein [Winogradskyella sp. MIT101101]|uniref:carboxypeptidase-like regulatory domain-containing protein n=1 Tax=Winogradskyella sp. MIT101101 TaxID=3098297 RepID=UPI00399B2271